MRRARRRAPRPPHRRPTWPPAASTRPARSPGCARPDRLGRRSTRRAPVDPRNVYAATKLHQEHLCALWGREAGATVVALRYHNVYGPRMPRDTPYAGVASIFRSALAAGRAPEVFEDGGQTRDFVHVRDVARANVLALTRSDVESGAYNIASGTPHTVGDLARALAGAVGPDLTPVVTGRWRLGDVRHIVASPARAEPGPRLRGRGRLRRRHGRVRPCRPARPGLTACAPRRPARWRRSGLRRRRRRRRRSACRLAIATGERHPRRPLGDPRPPGGVGRGLGGGVVCALRLPAPGGGARRSSLVALALRLAALAGPPVLSDDLYRYAWDGRVQVAGHRPLPAHAPSSRAGRPAGAWLWPDAAGCAEPRPRARAAPASTGRRCARSTRRVAQAWFTAVYRVAGIDARHKAWQVAGLVGDMALVGPAARWSCGPGGATSGGPRSTPCRPFPVVEVVNNGHVDGLAALFVVARPAGRRPPPAGLGRRPRRRRRPGQAVPAPVVGAGVRRRLVGPPARRRLRPVRARRPPRWWPSATCPTWPAVGAQGPRLPPRLPAGGALRRGRPLPPGRPPRPPAGLTAALAAAGLAAVAGWVLVRRPEVPGGAPPCSAPCCWPPRRCSPGTP